jgi:2-methylcitrate dehydratase PrpD
VGDEVRNYAENDQRFCEWAADLRWQDLPPPVVDAAVGLLTDFLGCTLGGLETDTARRCRSLASPARAGAHILGLPDRFPAPEAVRHNAIAAHVLEIDDVVASASLHPGAVVFPAALAVGERVDATGRDMLTAAVVAYELMIRLGEAVGAATHYAAGFHPTATCGVFGAAMAAAKVLGADSEELLHALGFAGTGAGGTLSYLNDGAPTKPVQVGNAASYGTTAALLNHTGVSGPVTAFEGRYGFFHAYASQADPLRLTKDLGTDSLRILSTSLKPFACCRYIQPGAALLLQLRAENDLRPERVERVRVGVVAPAMEIVGKPRVRKVRPQSVTDAQFSLPFCAGVVLHRGQLMPGDVSSSVGDSRVEVLAERVELVADPALDRGYPEHWGAWVEIITVEGQRLELASEDAKGDPRNPLSAKEIRDKVTALAGPERADRVLTAASEIVDGTVANLVAQVSERR